MYKDTRVRKEADFIVEVQEYELACGGCPTIYDFVDREGTSYDFYLRHGWATIECHETKEILASGRMEGFDGVCNWTDVERWAYSKGLELR